MPNNVEDDGDSDLILFRKRSIRTRAASTPNPLLQNGIDLAPHFSSLSIDKGLLPKDGNELPGFKSNGVSPTPHSWTLGSSLGLQWGSTQSIWTHGSNGTHQIQSSPPSDESKSMTFGSIESEVPLPVGRQYRSYSFNFGSDKDFSEPSSVSPDEATRTFKERHEEPIRSASDDGEADFAQFQIPKMRSRSKSSSAIYSMLTEGKMPPGFSDGSPDESEEREIEGTEGLNDYNSIWAMTQGISAGEQLQQPQESSSLLHRRSSTQPSSYPPPAWDNGLRIPNNHQEGFMPGQMTDSRFKQPRRFSHAPALYQDYAGHVSNNNNNNNNNNSFFGK